MRGLKLLLMKINAYYMLMVAYLFSHTCLKMTDMEGPRSYIQYFSRNKQTLTDFTYLLTNAFRQA